MENENISETLGEIARSSQRSKIVRLREIFDQVEFAKAKGATHKEIVAGLAKHGLYFDVPNFKNARSRILKEREMETLLLATSSVNESSIPKQQNAILSEKIASQTLVEVPSSFSVEARQYIADNNIDLKTLSEEEFEKLIYGDNPVATQYWKDNARSAYLMEAEGLSGDDALNFEAEYFRKEKLPMDNNLPDLCYSFRPGSEPGQYIAAIRKGESGCYNTNYNITDAEQAKTLVQKWNKQLGVTEEQAKCMEVGSMFGWEVPGAQMPSITNRIKVSLDAKTGSVCLDLGDNSTINFNEIPAIQDFAKQRPDIPEVVINKMLALNGGFNVVYDADKKINVVCGSKCHFADLDTIEEGWARGADKAVEQFDFMDLKFKSETVFGRRLTEVFDNIIYNGPILAVNNSHVLQSIGRLSVIWNKAELDCDLSEGVDARIRFNDGIGKVSVNTGINRQVGVGR